MPLRVRCDPQLPKTMQREHRDEATDVLPATFLNEAIRHPSCLSPRTRGRRRAATRDYATCAILTPLSRGIGVQN
jgi:hypothetical protein